QDYNMEAEDPQLFLANATDVVRRFRNHPSIVAWFGRNEGVPQPILNNGLDTLLAEGDRIAVGSLDATIWSVPGHTAGHIAFHLADRAVIFTGDTLFAMGCGRLFEGTAAQMHANMRRFAALPENTRVYCGHEYTLSNARFAAVAEPDNDAIAARLADVTAMREAGEPTIPTTIALERATNPFLRSVDAQELAERRAAKDAFKG
ncbi:hydroxyacylglutathione hydrolase, partial [Staphylococcus aureus]|nr:hydroxyacylglutathione hydrolase [Staphylococcus aureus]